MEKIYKSYHFGSRIDLTEQQLQGFIMLFNHPARACSATLGGRCAPVRHQIDGIGALVIKYYARGGLIRSLIKRTYLRWGKTRGQREFEILQKARGCGVNTPDPIAYAYRGRLFYMGWLVTRFIPQTESLAQLAGRDEKQIQAVMPAIVDQVIQLIRNGIHHVDLHPGNVLVSGSEQIYLVDFDKGYIFSGNRNSLRDRYLHRWKRAVKKHSLPASLDDLMESGLNQNF